MDPEDTLVDIIEAVYDRAMLKTGRNTFKMMKFLEAVSYTHLTLPTIYSV